MSRTIAVMILVVLIPLSPLFPSEYPGAFSSVAAPFKASPGKENIEGKLAPSFDLPLIGARGRIDSGRLFASNEFTFIIFWKSDCSHCIDALAMCEEFNQDYGGGDIGLAGINSNGGDIFPVKAVIAETGVTFPQLRDRNGSVAEAYGVPLSVFTIFLVDRSGTVVESVFDPGGEIRDVMEMMLAGEESEDAADEGISVVAVEEMPGNERVDTGIAGLTVSGEARLMFLSVKTGGDGATGPYGEDINPRNTLLHRFELELTRKIGRYLTVGTLLRVGNEDLEVLRSGPDYFDNRYGSAFAVVDAGGFEARLGYYTIAMTPLTLMRWDWDDNPRMGGNAGCGCGIAAGVLRTESLEQLGPDLRLEGARIEYGWDDFDLSVFYAIPRRARDISLLHTLSGQEEAAYSLELYGAQYRWQKYIPRMESMMSTGIHFLEIWENDDSIDPLALGYTMPFEWFRISLLSLTGSFPLTGKLSLRGEWIALNRTSINNTGPAKDEREDHSGGGMSAGFQFGDGRFVDLTCDYLSLESDFNSPLAAISYKPGMEGARVSGRFYYPDRRFALSVFYKKLREKDSAACCSEREHASTSGITADFDLENGLGGMIGYIDDGSWRKGEVGNFDRTRKVLVAGARLRFTRNSYIQAQYQRVENRDDSSGIIEESSSDLITLYLGAAF